MFFFHRSPIRIRFFFFIAFTRLLWGNYNYVSLPFSLVKEHFSLRLLRRLVILTKTSYIVIIAYSGRLASQLQLIAERPAAVFFLFNIKIIL